MRDVHVELGKDSYEILIGRNLGAELQNFIRETGFSEKALLISDTNVGKLYGENVLRSIREAGLSAELIMVPAGESSKSLQQAEQLYTAAIEHCLDRKSPIFALGGGVVGDLAGFIAATYMRGVPFVQIPTSLLAQVDSGVGGKVAVNHHLGKNLIGAFYQPKRVFMDMGTLDTLPVREIHTGLGEIVKYGVIYDADFFDFLEKNADKALSLEEMAVQHMVARSCEIKADVVSKDEKEGGLRRILNFGHTIAHAIEKETGYVRYNHGEAVAIGMIGAAYISREMGAARDEEVERLERLIKRMGLPMRAGGCTTDHMYRDIFHDKKTVGGRVNWVLMKEIGNVFVTDDVPEAVVRHAMDMVTEKA
ncbi:MAG: 3-dehydroquinate synthase [Veillonellaceae bacterium]|nr:3-dehydroquinate synthase [Veillonellaceae bacterium]